MTGTEIAALLAAIGGVLTAVFAGIRNLRGDKFRQDVEASAAVLSGQTNLIKTLQTEMERLKDDFAEARKEWADERATLRREHAEEMARLRQDHISEMKYAYERIDELGSQIYVLRNPPPPEVTQKETDV